jgi:hypothetical protein
VCTPVQAISDARHRKGGAGMAFELPGLNIPKGLEPWLPMYQQGLMYGSPEVGKAQLVDMTAVCCYTLLRFLLSVVP